MTNELITANPQTTIDGKYPTGAIVRRSISSTIYKTEFIDSAKRAHPAVIRICELDAECPEPAAVKRWRKAMELAHPNLLRIHAVGTSEVNGAPVEYEVMERADESLAGVLQERSLSEDEVREILRPAAEALRYLHKKGYAHGALRPSKVMAVGDQLKLNVDCAIRVADGGAPEKDMHALGALILECLGQKDSVGTFADIVWHCRDADLAKRWTAEQLAEYLNAPPGQSIDQIPVEARLEKRSSHRTPKWIFAGLAAVVLVVLLVALYRSKESGSAPVTPPPAVTQQHAPLPPPPPLVQPAPPQLAAVAPPREGRRGNGWSVIVAAYVSREAAEKRMRTLANKWRNFNLSVLEQHSEKAAYMVVLGENLSEDAAESLRQRAVNSGLPRDTYIKKMM